jgi:hypothetical protein
MVWLNSCLVLARHLYFAFSICPEASFLARRQFAEDICASARMPPMKTCAISPSGTTLAKFLPSITRR